MTTRWCSSFCLPWELQPRATQQPAPPLGDASVLASVAVLRQPPDRSVELRATPAAAGNVQQRRSTAARLCAAHSTWLTVRPAATAVTAARCSTFSTPHIAAPPLHPRPPPPPLLPHIKSHAAPTQFGQRCEPRPLQPIATCTLLHRTASVEKEFSTSIKSIQSNRADGCAKNTHARPLTRRFVQKNMGARHLLFICDKDLSTLPACQGVKRRLKL